MALNPFTSSIFYTLFYRTLWRHRYALEGQGQQKLEKTKEKELQLEQSILDTWKPKYNILPFANSSEVLLGRLYTIIFKIGGYLWLMALIMYFLVVSRYYEA
jgi:hypothetical protein